MWYSQSVIWATDYRSNNFYGARSTPDATIIRIALMTSKKQRTIVCAVAVHLLLIAVVCYAAFPVPVPEQPIRLIYRTNAGKVLFDHKTHSSKTGYGLACADCHHHPTDEAAIVSCGKCHPKKINKEAAPEYCLECHSDAEVRDSKYPRRSDAYHQQCARCHEEYGKGPKSGSANCSQCHVL